MGMRAALYGILLHYDAATDLTLSASFMSQNVFQFYNTLHHILI